MFRIGQFRCARAWGAPFAFWLRLGVAFAAAGVCAGCFQPLYGEGLATGRPDIRDSLAAIDVKQIEAAANTPEARLAVQIRNDLLFNFTGGGYPQPPTHELTVRIAGRSTAVTIDPNTKLPTIEVYSLSTTYTLAEIATKKVVVTGRASAPVSYDTLGQQRFARIRGMQDAESRAAKVISDNITSRLASYFVSGG
jgi:LPS-assembly lipoprotein